MKLLRAFVFIPLLAAQDAPPASVELGYRWNPSTTGSAATYRSVVNLGEGVKLLNADWTLLSHDNPLLDRLDTHIASWGDDPYSTLRIEARKTSVYRLNLDYRNIAYFNFLPSYANPASKAGPLDWNSSDTHMRSFNAELDLIPDRKISPYLAFSRSSEYGRGISSFVGDRNEYPVASSISTGTTHFRGGIRLALNRLHLTLEEGGTWFKDDEGLSQSQSNYGDQLGLLGQRLVLNGLGAGFRVRGDSAYTTALLASNPYSWLNVSGTFVFSQPRTNTQYQDLATGTLYSNALLKTLATQRDSFTGSANMPHSTGSLNIELRPTNRLRIVNYWFTDRMHAGQGADNRMAVNYNQEELSASYELTRSLTLRGGYRYIWGDTEIRALLNPLPIESGSLNRNVGIGGLTYRPIPTLRIISDIEIASSDHVYYRTSLRDYRKARVRASYDIRPHLRLSGEFSLLNNSDPDPLVRSDFKIRTESVSVFWTASEAKHLHVLLDYTRSSLRSSISYLTPQDLTSATSIYADNGHTGTATAGYRWLSLGGSFFRSSGSRPTQYYQPLARGSVPLNKHLAFHAEWRWYGFTERDHGYENFTSHQIMTSIRWTR